LALEREEDPEVGKLWKKQTVLI